MSFPPTVIHDSSLNEKHDCNDIIINSINVSCVNDMQNPKLGDAWYVSNVSIIFDCSMLYYILFWTLSGFIIHFYIIFGTKLLTGGPAQNCCFLPISEFHRKRISNGLQTEWNLRERDFRNEHDPGDLDPTSRNQQGSHEVGGTPTPPRHALHPRGPLLLHRRTPSSYIYLRTPYRSNTEPKT